jgi:urease beta subunit
MLHAFSSLALFAQMAVVPAMPRAVGPSTVPFDTTIAVGQMSGLALNLESGGKVKIVGGDSKVVRVLVTDHGRRCADCIVAVSPLRNGLDVRTGRTHEYNSPADLAIRIEVPTQTNILLTSAGGQVEIEGIDGYVSGTTDFGAVHLFRLSGAVKIETKRGDVTLRQSYVRGSIHTNDGGVLLEDVGGDVQGTTSRGRVVERRVDRISPAP